jgi:hypothetical protein
MDANKLKELVDRMPSPSDGEPTEPGKKPGPPGILSDVDKAVVDAALAEMEAGGAEAVAGLAAMLVDSKPAIDSKARHAIHALVTRACGAGEAKRLAIAAALTEAVAKDGPPEPRAFLLRQVQRSAGPASVDAVAALLTNDALAAPATATLQQIGSAAAPALRAAVAKLKGRSRVGVVLALGALRDAASAEVVRPLLGEADPETHLAAAAAVAQIGDAGSLDAMLKVPAAAGEPRRRVTAALFVYAERLAETGKRAEARRVLGHILDTRTEPGETYLRESASRIMKTIEGA